MPNEIRRQHLMLVEQLLAQGDRSIACQERLLADLERRGRVSDSFRHLLAHMYAVRAHRIETRDRLLRQLGE
jgi:hypothetical protein